MNLKPKGMLSTSVFALAVATGAGRLARADQIHLQFLPLKVTGVTTPQQEVLSGPDGTATVSFTVAGTGVGTCKARVGAATSSNVYVETLVEVTPAGGFPRTVQLKLPRPGTYQIVAADRLASAGDCAGKGSTTVTVKRHPEFPCSLYPGFKRDSGTYGDTWGCVPATPPATPAPDYSYLCAGDTTFHNYYGYVFGCLPPAFTPGK
jgi:hypothetical protein